jgi:DNA-binding transcriptional ArsR family regulator
LIINDIVNQIDSTLAALADPTRRLVVEILQGDPLRASVIADRLGMSRAAVSRHLRLLERAGLVSVATPAEDARGRAYRLEPDGLAALGAWLDQVQAFWSEQLGAFKEHAERSRGGRGSRR